MVREFYFIWIRGPTRTILGGFQRCGKEIAGTHVAPDGILTTPYARTLGGGTVLLVYGRLRVTEM